MHFVIRHEYPETGDDPFSGIKHQIRVGQNAILEKLDMISQEVQANLDQARALTTVVGSVNSGMQALTKLVSDLQDQIRNQAPSLSADDKAALLESTTDMQDSITTLKAGIPANTSVDPVNPPVTTPVEPIPTPVDQSGAAGAGTSNAG